jgi:CHAD domain-containing protein
MEPDNIKLKEIKPVLSSFISRSQKLLQKSDIPDEKAVHDVRVLMKQSKAIIKLVSPLCDMSFFDRDTIDFTNVGKSLAGLRSYTVFRKVLKDLKKEYSGFSNLASENKFISSFSGKTELVPDEIVQIKDLVLHDLDLLKNAGFRIRFQPMKDIDPNELFKQLEKTFLTASDLYIKSRYNLKPSSLHRFRKCVKDLQCQLYFFRPLNPGVVKSVEKKLGIISQNLGRYNDLNQLVKALGYSYPNEKNSPVLDEFILIIRGRQDYYLSKMWPAAFKIFCPGKRLANIFGFKLLII